MGPCHLYSETTTTTLNMMCCYIINDGSPSAVHRKMRIFKKRWLSTKYVEHCMALQNSQMRVQSKAERHCQMISMNLAVPEPTSASDLASNISQQV